ncbi:MAG: hypothetical protein EHM12_10220 [Dehalococcoidia bacterium]|nr:MAG: hypothetical protein EHM12_10220 [Dehalococcoidia bacterium]
MFQVVYGLEKVVKILTCYELCGNYYVTTTYEDQPRIDTQRITKEDWYEQLKYCQVSGIFLYATSNELRLS